jgi:hypothetical protein
MVQQAKNYRKNQWYFCDGTRQNILEVLSQKDTSRNGIPETSFPGTGINYTTHLQPNFGSLFAFWNPLQKKECWKELF